MADPKIPLADLPYGIPGAFDRVAGVDTATGAAKQFPMPQAGEPKDYQTRASLPSASGLTDGTAAHVNNDPNPDNNGRWAVFGGQWVQSADRVTGLEGRTAAIEHEASALLEESTSARVFGDTSEAVAPTSDRSTAYYFIFGVLVPESSVRVSRVRVWSRAAGDFEVSIWRNTSGTTWTKMASATRSATVTASPVWYDVNLQVLPGDRVGFKPLTAGAIGQVGGDQVPGYGTVRVADSSYDSTEVVLAPSLTRASWEVETVLPFRADSSRLERLLSRRRYGSVSMRNIREDLIPGVQTIVFTQPMPAGVGSVTRLGVNSSNGLSYEVSNWRADGSGQFVKVSSQIVHTSTDPTEATEFRIGSLDLPVMEGDRIGLSRNPDTFNLPTGYASGQLEFQQIPNGAESFSPGATTTAPLRLWFEVEGAFRDQEPPSRFSRKTVWSFGDSFTKGSMFGSYPDALIDHLGANVVNYGRSGAFPGALVGIMTPADHRANGWTDKVDLTYADVDAVTIMIGQNGGVSGSMSDIPAESIYAIPYVIGGTTISTVKQHLERFGNTYYGNLGLILEYLRWVKPQMEVFLLSPTLSASRPSLDTFRVEMQALANHFGVRHIDTRAESGITLRNNSLTTYDGDHPSWAGMSMIARYVAAKMVG